MYQESSFLGAFFGTMYCRIAGASRASPPGPSPGLCPVPTGGLTAPPDSLLLQAMNIVPSAGYHFHSCPHDRFGPPL